MSAANTPDIATIENDNPNPVVPDIIPQEPVAEVPAEPEPAPLPPSTRDEIAARFRANRVNTEGPPGEPGDYSAPPFILQQQAAEAEAAATPPEETQPEAPADTGTYKLKVRGNEFSMSRADVLKTANLTEEEAAGIPMPALLRAAQINAAADDYLAEAKTTHRDSRTAARNPAAPPAADDADPDLNQPPAKQDAPVLTAADLAEKVQFGDREEAAQAIDALIQRSLDTRTQAEREASFQDANLRAVKDFQAANPDIFLTDDPIRQELLFTTSARHIREDLIRAGLPRAEVESAVTDPGIAAEWLSQARQRGLPVRPPNEILSAAAQDVRTRLGLTAPAAASTPPSSQPTRQDLKRGLTPQPNTANLPPAAAAAPPAERSRTSVILGMRKARGQAT